MTLMIGNGPGASSAGSFRDDVLAVLESFSPGVKADADGRVTFDVGDVSCWSYRTHRAGCNLIAWLAEQEDPYGRWDASLVDSELTKRSRDNFTVTIVGNNTEDYAASADESSRAIEVSVDPDPTPGALTYNDGQFDTRAMLAHELIHALHHVAGTSIADKYTEEYQTVRSENQIRRELNLPLRETYGGDEEVKYPACGTLTTCDRKGCGFCGTCCVPVLRLPGQWWRRLRQPRAASQGPRVLVRDVRERSAFAGFAEAMDPAIRPVLEMALRVRERASQRPAVSLGEQECRTSRDVALLEGVSLTGAYRAVLVAAAGDGVSLTTNLVRRDARGTLTGRPGPLVRYRLPATEYVDRLARLVTMRFEEGVGARPDACDGVFQLLTLRSGSRDRRTALYAYSYEGFYASWARPAGRDGERWDAISGAHALWRAVMNDERLDQGEVMARV